MKKKVIAIVDQKLLPWEASRAVEEVEEEIDSLHHSGGKEQSDGGSSADQALVFIDFHCRKWWY